MASPITTHVLDTNLGGPAADIAVELFKQVDGEWTKICLLYTSPSPRD